MAMPTIEERLALARRHVDAGHLIIVHQRQMVERHKAEGRDTKAAEELLAVLERTQKVFERDLAELEKDGGEKFSRVPMSRVGGKDRRPVLSPFDRRTKTPGNVPGFS